MASLSRDRKLRKDCSISVLPKQILSKIERFLQISFDDLKRYNQYKLELERYNKEFKNKYEDDGYESE